MSDNPDIEISEQRGVRYLHFGSEWVQGAMRIRAPWALELAYARDMMAGLLWFDTPQRCRRALVIGLGAASIPKFLYRHLPECTVDVAEIAPGVVDVAVQCFRAPEADDRMRYHVGDGAQYVASATPASLDLIVVDAYDADAGCAALETDAFLASLRRALSPHGVAVINRFSRAANHAEVLARCRTAFDGAVCASLPCPTGNLIVHLHAHRPSPVPLSALRERATRLGDLTATDFAPSLSRLVSGQGERAVLIDPAS